VGKEQNDTTVTTWAHITGNRPHHQRGTEEKRTKEAPHYVATGHAEVSQMEEGKPETTEHPAPNSERQAGLNPLENKCH